MWWMILIASLVSAVLYRFGGMPRPMNTKIRDLGCPTVAFITLFFILKLQASWYVHLLSFGFLFASLTTYWDSIPFNKGDDNFYMHGAIIGLAYLPYAIAIGCWIPFVIRIILLGAFMGLMNIWDKKIEKATNGLLRADWVAELLRGFAITATLPLLLIGG